VASDARHLLGLVLLVATGCSPLKGARWSSTTPEGGGQIILEPRGLVRLAPRSESLGFDHAFGFRKPLARDVDVGLAASFVDGVHLDGRFQLAREETAELSTGVAFAAQLLPLEGREYLELAMPNRVGLNIDASQLGFGFAPGLRVVREDLARTGLVFAPRGTVAFDIGFSPHFHLIPSVEATGYVGSDSTLQVSDAILLTGGLATVF
jgi:hypothetical protein